MSPSGLLWLSGSRRASAGKLERLEWIRQILGLPQELDGGIRYQLMHRTAAAATEALWTCLGKVESSR